MVSWPRVTSRCQSLLEAELDKSDQLESELESGKPEGEKLESAKLWKG